MPRKKAVEVVLEPQGNVDITKARDLRDELLAALEKGTSVQVKLAGLSDVDLTFFQLLCAAHREAVKLGKTLNVTTEGLHENVRDLLQEGGIAREFDCNHAKGHQCLWCGEGW